MKAHILVSAGRVVFLHHVWYGATFWFQEQNNVDNTAVVAEQCFTEPRTLWFSQFLLMFYEHGGCTRSWAGTESGQLT